MSFRSLEGLKEHEQIVISAQFMLDSESRLREAIQKMLDVQKQNAASRFRRINANGNRGSGHVGYEDG